MRILPESSERGAAAILIALSMVLMMGVAAIAIDWGFGVNERRQAQTAADVGVMAGALEAPGSPHVIRDQIFDFTQRNVIGAYDDWQAKWENCVDSERLALNADGFNFVPVPAPSGWSVTRIDCISIDQGGFVRVSLPQLEFSTTFGAVLGIDQLTTRASAIARIGGRGGGGILPFGLTSSSGEGQQVCLRSAASGLADDPCPGNDEGNFGAIESPHYGTHPEGPARNCTKSPKKNVLEANIAFGIDHMIAINPTGPPVGIQDTCANMDNGFTPDTLETFQGISQGLEEGLATGPVTGGFQPRLQQGSNPKRNVFGHNLDNRPLWYYIDPGLTEDDVPLSCLPSAFTPGSWQQLEECFDDYLSSVDEDGDPWTSVLFIPEIADSPRFSYVPQFWQSSFGPGNQWRHVARFKAAWLQGTWWKSGNDIRTFHPGEPGGPSLTGPGNWSLIQLTAFVIPDSALPEELRGTGTMPSGLNPFVPELFR